MKPSRKKIAESRSEEDCERGKLTQVMLIRLLTPDDAAEALYQVQRRNVVFLDVRFLSRKDAVFRKKWKKEIFLPLSRQLGEMSADLQPFSKEIYIAAPGRLHIS